CTCGLVDKDQAGHAAALFGLRGGSARHVVADAHGRSDHALELEHLGGHLEIHAVAAVVSIQLQHAGAAVGSAHGFDAVVHSWAGKDIADSAAVQQAFSDISEEHGELPGPATRGDS